MKPTTFNKATSIGRLWLNSWLRNQNELRHYGVKGMKWGVRNGPPYPIARDENGAPKKTVAKDEERGRIREVGLQFFASKMKDYVVKDFDTDEVFHFSEGSKLTNQKTFAGKGTKSPLDEHTLDVLCEKEGGNPEDWQHCKGNGVIDYYGEDRPAEVHWFQTDKLGKRRFKIKKWLDE